jgi:hypothetical protein
MVAHLWGKLVPQDLWCSEVVPSFLCLWLLGSAVLGGYAIVLVSGVLGGRALVSVSVVLGSAARVTVFMPVSPLVRTWARQSWGHRGSSARQRPADKGATCQNP